MADLQDQEQAPGGPGEALEGPSGSLESASRGPGDRPTPIEPEPLDFRDAAARWRKKAEQHWKQSKKYDELAVEARRKAESADRNAALFDRLAAEQTEH